jgi:hypothetical protein
VRLTDGWHLISIVANVIVDLGNFDKGLVLILITGAILVQTPQKCFDLLLRTLGMMNCEGQASTQAVNLHL